MKKPGVSMRLAFAVLSAFFVGIAAVLSKIGIKNINSNLGTAIRIIIVFVFSCLFSYTVLKEKLTKKSFSGLLLLVCGTLLLLI